MGAGLPLQLIGCRSSANNIYLARSDTSDPTGDWDGVRFAADTVFPAEFHDYDTLAVDADGVYICTNDFPVLFLLMIPVIRSPKADLLQATPTIVQIDSALRHSLGGFARCRRKCSAGA